MVSPIGNSLYIDYISELRNNQKGLLYNEVKHQSYVMVSI